MILFDELSTSAPEWYLHINAALGRDKKEEAMRLTRDALTRCRDANDRVGEMMALRSMAKGYLAKGDTWRSRQSAAESLEIAKSLQDSRAEAASMNLLAKVHVKERLVDSAVRAASDAVDKFRQLGDKIGEAASIDTLAQARAAEDNFDQAGELAMQATAIFKDLHEQRGQVSALHTTIQIKLAENRYFHALVVAQQMVAIYSELGDHRGEGQAHLLATEVSLAEDNLQEALDSSSAAADLFDKVGDHSLKAKAVQAMARAFQAGGQPKELIQAAEVALELYSRTSNKRGQAEVLVLLASGHAAVNKRTKAIECLQEASSLFRSCKAKRDEANTFLKATEIYLALFESPSEMPAGGWVESDYAQAVRVGEQAVSLLADLGETRTEAYARTLTALGGALARLGSQSREQAKSHAEKAKEIFQELEELGGEAEATMLIAMVLEAQEQHENAGIMARKVRDLAEEAGEFRLVKKVDNHFGHTKRSKEKPKDAQITTPYMIQLISYDKPIIEYDSYQGRKATVGRSAAVKHSSKEAHQDLAVEEEAFYKAPDKKPVLYTIKWHKWPRSPDREQLVIPESERHLIAVR